MIIIYVENTFNSVICFSYKTTVQELSAIFHDRTSTPGQELVHWVEHVIKTNGET